MYWVLYWKWKAECLSRDGRVVGVLVVYSPDHCHCPESWENIDRPHITNPGKEPNLEFDLCFLLNTFFFLTVYKVFLISSASVRSILFLSFIVPIFVWNVPLVSLIFLKITLVFPILLFSSISLHWSLRKAFLSLLALLRNFAFKWVYLSFSPLLFTSLHFTAICKASSDSHLYFFSMGMVLILASCTMSRICTHSSSGTLSNLVA